MGLAASQARLLTITARKGDCEFQSMAYSHQKIALSRSMTDISNEYQEALNQTKLVYDFYGTGDETTPLTYGLLMAATELNGFMPMLTTDAAGKVVLNTAYASAAKAAGIPQEGFGCLPSSTVRNRFIDAMAVAGIISTDRAELCKAADYSQGIGMGSSDLVSTETKTMTLDQLFDYYAENGNLAQLSIDGTEMDSIYYGADGPDGYDGYWRLVKGSVGQKEVNYDRQNDASFTLQDLYEGNYSLLATINGDKNSEEAKIAKDLPAQWGNISFWQDIFDELDRLIGSTGDSSVVNALAEARNKTQELVSGDTLVGYFNADTKEPGWGGYNNGNFASAMEVLLNRGGDDDNHNATIYPHNVHDHYGYYVMTQRGGLDYHNNNKNACSVGISVSNVIDYYMRCFADAMDGEKSSRYAVSTNGTKDGVSLDDYTFEVAVEHGINTDGTLDSGFYDALFNQICMRGWVENANVDDKEYLREMYQSGKLFLTTCADDGYYYQGNYATNSYIREVADEEAIALAEAKYNTEKQKINSKEEIIDMKMKNLDTEISSLTTEYDTVKSLISKNIEKGFKRYDA
ncbi:hypothetical protein IJZ97_01905 [bacterium]|nr:hypothetical protein [bacterium]